MANLISCFLSVLKIVVLLNIFVETYFFKDPLIIIVIQKNNIYFK